MASGALTGALPAISSPVELLWCAGHRKGLIHMRKILSFHVFQAADGQRVSGSGRSMRIRLYASLCPDGRPCVSGINEPMVSPNRRCSEGTDCIAPNQGRSCFGKRPDGLNS